MSINNLCQNQQILQDLAVCISPYISGGSGGTGRTGATGVTGPTGSTGPTGATGSANIWAQIDTGTVTYTDSAGTGTSFQSSCSYFLYASGNQRLLTFSLSNIQTLFTATSTVTYHFGGLTLAVGDRPTVPYRMGSTTFFYSDISTSTGTSASFTISTSGLIGWVGAQTQAGKTGQIQLGTITWLTL